MPSHPRSPLPRPPPLLPPLSTTTSPTYTPLASPLDERRPLLRTARSFGADDLRRRSHQISDLLFRHGEGDAQAGLGGLEDAFNGTDGSERRAEDEREGRGLSRARSSFFGSRRGSLSRLRTGGGGYDGEFKAELEGEAGNGVRSWYDNYTAIDWIHDTIKHSLRLRRLRRLKRTQGLRGQLINLWDGFQGWLLVTIVGFVTACIAFSIIRAEMWLFDLKEGYCAAGWTRAKRFCCRAESAPEKAFGTFVLRGWAPSAVEEGGECEAWTTWVDVWRRWTGEGEGAGEAASYIAYIAIALVFAVLASVLTIYFTASTSVYSSKDSLASPRLGNTAKLADLPGASASPPASTSKYGATDQVVSASTSEASLDTALQGHAEPVAVPRTRKTLYYAAGSGIPEIKTILSGFVIRGYLGSWTLGVKSVGLALSVASGLSLGKEGPFVHIASCVANIVSRFWRKYDRNEGKRREVLSAACAAGVAVSFGAPVGGVLFSLEEVSYYFPPRTMLRSFWCAMIAAMTLKMFDPFGSGKIVLFAVTYDKDWHSFELLGFLFLAIFGGVYGACFCRANIAWTKHVRNGTFLKSHPIVEVALVTLVTACIAFYNPWSKMGGTELISSLFSECYKSERLSGLCVTSPSQVGPLVLSLGAALVLKAALTTITFGLKLPAGIFIPTLAVGALAGRIAGLGVEVLHAKYPRSFVFEACRMDGESGPLPFGQACVLPGVWAMIGAAAALAGVTRTTVSLAVIVFELTGTLTYSVPTMLAVLLAKTVADSIEPRSIYDLVIEVADLPYLDAKAEYVHDSTPHDILDAGAPIISLDTDNTVSSLYSQLAALYASGTSSGFPLVASDDGGSPRMFGYIGSKELEHGLSLARAQGLSDSTTCTFRVAQGARRGLAAEMSAAATPGLGGGAESETFDLSWLTDQAPLTVSARSPMELIHEMFVKLGSRYVVVVDERGCYLGPIEKNRYLLYLRWLEKRIHEKTSKSKWFAQADAADGARDGVRRGRSEAREVA
ncbi:Chloride channel [Rhodotorula toruloides]|uniref:Chloride channel n=1 Tax=Rhodotorula toruloides TaxID=5286 RepID=A0A2T0A3P2_RHOTO|nr:Chloride channel [Rhodotorula toruloides]PRQ72632.1 Chloride channel [Rhodotorula toruloides]